jgi:hypothetical protein
MLSVWSRRDEAGRVQFMVQLHEKRAEPDDSPEVTRWTGADDDL